MKGTLTPALLLGLAACGNPGDCATLCGGVEGSCGFGEASLCEQTCESASHLDDEHFRLRDCLEAADCGHLLAGDCATTGQRGACAGHVRLLAVAAPGCFEGVRTVALDEDCAASGIDADWGSLGAPSAGIGPDGAQTLRFNACEAPLHAGSTDCGACPVHVAELF